MLPFLRLHPYGEDYAADLNSVIARRRRARAAQRAVSFLAVAAAWIALGFTLGLLCNL